jgi:hypothetical protein
MKTRGEAILIVLGAIVLAGLGFIVLKPMFSGDRGRAEDSREATQQLVAATDAQAASAAASVSKIGEANTAAPGSPSRDFIAREVPLALAKLPAPDPAELIAAERRRAAVMEGRAEEARALYEKASERAVRLQRERDAAIEQRRAVDSELAEVAAARAGAERQRLILIGVAALAGAGWLLRVSPGSMAKIITDVRAGVPLTQAFDTYTSPLVQKLINREARLATPPKE